MATAVVLAVSTVATAVQTRRARRLGAQAAADEAEADRIKFEAQQKQARAEQRIREVQLKRARVSLTREARRRRADIRTSAAATGVGVSSAAAGAVGGIRTQAAAALSTSRVVGGIQKGIVQSNIEAGEQAQSFLDLATISRQAQSAALGRAGVFGAIATVSSAFSGGGSSTPRKNLSGISGVTRGSQQDRMLAEQNF